MAFNDYIDSDYTVSGYFTGDVAQNAVEGNATLSSVVSFTAALNEVDMSYIDPTYIEAGYFEGSASGGVQEANAALGVFVSVVSSLSTIKSFVGFCQTACETNISVGKITGATATLQSQSSLAASGNTTKDIILSAFGNGVLSCSGGKTINGSVVVPGEQTYVDGTYIESGYFVVGIGVVPVITATLSALVGKLQSATTDIVVTGQYVDPTYLEQGYFEGTVLYGVVGAFSVSAQLDEFVVPGQIFGSANLSAVFTLSAIPTELRAPTEASATLLSNLNASSNAERTRDYNADVSTSFNSNINATKAFGFSSSLDVTATSNSDARRIRTTSSSIESQSSVSTLNSRIRGTATTMSVQFQITTFGQRARAIDLYAFTNGALVAQANVVRDSNALANTFFNVGTDFIRQRNVSAEGDATVFISNIPTRIRDTSLETQDAFSFASTVAATKRISQSLVATFNSDNQFSLTRNYTANASVQSTLDITPSVVRNVESQINVISEQNVIVKKITGIVSNIVSTASIFGRGNANLDCDMEAFGNGALLTRANAKFRANSEMFSIPGFNIVINNVRVRYNQSQISTTLTSQSEAVKIHPFVAEPFSSTMTTTIIGGRTSPTGANFTTSITIQANGIVRFYFFPTTFSVSVADEPLANTFFSRTRETGVNI